MTIQLSEHREEFVRSLVEGGQFASEEAVVDEALQLLEERYGEPVKLAELRREIALGIEEANRGESAPFDPQATLARVRARRIASMGQG